jgi:radical SAM superfamily enzyme YgiQ (UPF0313 family)
MHITLIKPGLGKIAGNYKLQDGSMEPISLGIIAGLIEEPDEVVMYDDRVEKIPSDPKTDLVAITVDAFSAMRAYEIATQYRSKGIKVILGGMHVTLLPDEAIQYADAIVVGDAELVWKQVMEDTRNHKLKKQYQAPPGLPQANCFPNRKIYKGKKYLPVSLIQFGRGCKFSCTFCAVSQYFKHSHQCRKMEDVLYEIEKDKLKIILFTDDNLVANKEELKIFLKELIPFKVKWASQASIEMTDDRELLKLMADSGCMGNLIGFDSININSLNSYKKAPNLRNFNNYRETIEILRDHGFLTWASFMMGNDFDTLETIEKTVEFSIKNKFTAAFFHVLMPYPATELYKQFERENRLLFDGKWWLHPDYRYNDATFIPKLMTPEELSHATIQANKDFFSVSSVFERMMDSKTHFSSLIKFLIYTRLNMVMRSTSI